MPLNPTLAQFKIFVGSPRDVEDERGRTGHVVQALQRVFRPKGLLPILLRYEDLPPKMGRPQHTINELVDDCDLFVGVLDKEWGTPTGSYSSGFEEEFTRARTRFDSTGSPEISIFVRNPRGHGKTEEVRRFMETQVFFWNGYSSSEEYERNLHALILGHLLRVSDSPVPTFPAGQPLNFGESLAASKDSTAQATGIETSRQPTAEEGAGAMAERSAEAVPTIAAQSTDAATADPLLTTGRLLDSPATEVDRKQSWSSQSLAASKLPTVTIWDERFITAYEDPQARYSTYSKRLLEPNFNPVDDATRMEQIICLCVERQAVRALSAIAEIDVDIWPIPRLVALHRLIGTLRYEIGDSWGAKAAYERALDLASGLPEATKAITFDLLRLSELRWNDLPDRLEEARRMPGWLGQPAYDHAVARSSDAFVKALFFEVVRPESSHRFSSGHGDFVRQYNLALALAYFTGDFESVTQARESLARRAAALAKTTSDARLAILAFEEAVASGNCDITKELLGALGPTLVAELGDEANSLVRITPAQPTGPAAERLSMMRLELIGGLGPYLADETRSSLVQELASTAETFLLGTAPDRNLLNLVCGKNQRAQTYFTRPFRAVAQFAKADLGRLVRALTTSSETPNDRFSLWEMALYADWAAMDAAIVASAVARLEACQLSEDEPNLSLTLLSQIRAEVPIYGPPIDRALLSHDDAVLLRDDRWSLVLYSRNEKEITAIGRLARTFIRDLADELNRASPKDGISASPEHRSDILPLLARHYPDAMALEEWDEGILSLLNASANPHCYAGHKASLFGNLALVVRRLGPKLLPRSAESIGARIVNDEPARTFSASRLWRPSVGLESVRARLIELRHSATFDPESSDRDNLLVALQADDDENLKHALWVSSHLAGTGWNRELVSALILQHLTGKHRTANALALWCALENNVYPDTALEKVAFDGMIALVHSSEAYVARTALYWLGKDATVIPAGAQARVAEAVGAALQAKHSGIRLDARKAKARLDALLAQGRGSPTA